MTTSEDKGDLAAIAAQSRLTVSKTIGAMLVKRLKKEFPAHARHLRDNGSDVEVSFASEPGKSGYRDISIHVELYTKSRWGRSLSQLPNRVRIKGRYGEILSRSWKIKADLSFNVEALFTLLHETVNEQAHVAARKLEDEQRSTNMRDAIIALLTGAGWTSDDDNMQRDIRYDVTWRFTKPCEKKIFTIYVGTSGEKVTVKSSMGEKHYFPIVSLVAVADALLDHEVTMTRLADAEKG